MPMINKTKKIFHDTGQTSLFVPKDGSDLYKEERDEEEYFYLHPQPISEEIESVTINFLNDDRDGHFNKKIDKEPERIIKTKITYDKISNKEYVYSLGNRTQIFQDDESHLHFDKGGALKKLREKGFSTSGPRDSRFYLHENEKNSKMTTISEVDYSTRDFNKARAVIDAASRNNRIPETNSKTILNNNYLNSNQKIRQVGDTIIVTEHRDPYSFYWQLDQQRKAEEEPKKRPTPPTDYVIDVDEEYELPVQSTILSPDSHDSGVNMNESHYSRPQKQEAQLPYGWEKHEDPSGFSYYWHVDSGTIQRNLPTQKTTLQEPLVSVGQQTTSAQLQNPKHEIARDPVVVQQQPIIEEHAFKQTTTKRMIENRDEDVPNETFKNNNKAIKRFVVRSLGWLEIPEEELSTASKSSVAVNNAISELTTLEPSQLSSMPKWGNGKELILEIDDTQLSLLYPETQNVLNAERIQQLRVWGVGKENNRDFAYVVRDRNSRRFLCHVFRCDTSSRIIANTLKDTCRNLMTQRRPSSLNPSEDFSERRIKKESLLLTPIDEPKRIIRCHFIGVTQVPRATGIEVLNGAVDRLVRQIRSDSWVLSDVSIAPSNITIVEAANGNQISQCRVRYLSFLGIGQDIKHCAFIMHTSAQNFMCYVFHVEPTAAIMAKTIEAACKLRYQKVLDAHMNTIGNDTGFQTPLK